MNRRGAESAEKILSIMLFSILVMAVLCFSNNVFASEAVRNCEGNLETFDKKIIQAGVSYKISYVLSGDKVRVSFAGREIEALSEVGKSWKGHWIKKIDNDTYFSFLPDDGGTIKFQFAKNEWYSGNCL